MIGNYKFEKQKPIFTDKKVDREKTDYITL